MEALVLRNLCRNKEKRWWGHAQLFSSLCFLKTLISPEKIEKQDDLQAECELLHTIVERVKTIGWVFAPLIDSVSLYDALKIYCFEWSLRRSENKEREVLLQSENWARRKEEKFSYKGEILQWA